jgi:hypothetical protein
VTTSSICEGLSISLVWANILEGKEIIFAHRPFKWANLASNNAGVTVVVVGVSNRNLCEVKRIFEGDTVRDAKIINPYLLSAEYVAIEKSSTPKFGLPVMVMGAMPRDGGNLLMSAAEKIELLQQAPEASRWIRRYMGSAELTSPIIRYCLWVDDQSVKDAEKVPAIKKRLELVAQTRSESTLDSTRQFAAFPHRFVYIAGQSNSYTIGLSAISSERREYLPVDVLDRMTIASNKLFALYDEPMWAFSLICSKIHLAWIATVCGKMRTDYSYSNTLGWNTFPVPALTVQNKAELTRCAENILLAREVHFPKTIADLYDPEGMPDNLRRAHDANDEVLERIYIGRRFKNDTERLEKLFELYTKMTKPKVAV